MAEYQLNRARLATSPMPIPYTKANNQTQILADGVVASAPLVALAYSFAVLTFEGNSTHAGNNITIACGDYSITLTLDNNGEGELSLVPFIRNAVLNSQALDNPLYCANGADFQQNNFRGYIDLTITETNQSPVAMRIDYIFGNYAPKGEMVTDLYFDYDANGETWCNVDSATHYNANGVGIDFEDNWCNINEIVEDEPYGDFMLPIDVAWYYGSDDIQFDTINYHFRYDCRADNVIKVRWLDTDGNINTRKFGISAQSHGASTSSTWQRPHAIKEIVDGYDRGKDEWATLTPKESITIGDDCIPMTHYNWLKGLASSTIIEAYLGGVWVRCNRGDITFECDPRKAQFSASLTLTLPTDDVQQF